MPTGGRPNPDQNAGQSGGGGGGGNNNGGSGGNQNGSGGNNGGGGGSGQHDGNNPYPDSSIKHILYKVGFRGQSLEIAYGIAMAESGGSAHALADDSDDLSYGLFQINMIGSLGPARRAQYNLDSNEDLYDPVKNARIAYAMSQHGTNFTPWTTYTSGAYKAEMSGNSPVQGAGANYSTSGGGAGGAGGGGGGGSYNSPAQDKLTPQEMAEKYGWAMSFLKSEPELWDLFQKAVNQNWSSDMFAAKLRDTKWYQHNSETARRMQLLQKSDPATWADRLHETKAAIQDAAGQMGATLNDHQLQQVAENALMFGWSDPQIKNTLADYIKRIHGSFTGAAGDNEDQLRSWASSMGVRVSNQYLKNAVSSIAAGNWDMNRAKDHLSKMAMSAFPALRDELKGNPDMTVMDVASPYIQSMASLLELNPNEIDLFNPKIRRALGTKNMDGKPEMKSIWEFENDLRNDPAWLKTHNAADAIGGAARQVLTDFGILG